MRERLKKKHKQKHAQADGSQQKNLLADSLKQAVYKVRVIHICQVNELVRDQSTGKIINNVTRCMKLW